MESVGVGESVSFSSVTPSGRAPVVLSVWLGAESYSRHHALMEGVPPKTSHPDVTLDPPFRNGAGPSNPGVSEIKSGDV